MDKKTFKIGSELKIKRCQIRIIKRKSKLDKDLLNREVNLKKGSIWGVPDKSVPFDYYREKNDIKDALRPCLILQTPKIISYNERVLLAPGTGKFHNDYECFPVDVQSADLTKRTYFLLYFKWFSMQNALKKYFTELNYKLLNELEALNG